MKKILLYIGILSSQLCSAKALANGPERVLTPCNFTASVAPTDVSCPGGTNGAATVSITGTSAPYVIEWFNGHDEATINNLSEGVYFVKVTDKFGCFSNTFVTIREPEEFELTLVPTHLVCFGEADGAVDLTVTGGTTFNAPAAPYLYSWEETAITTEDLSGVLAGKHTITVTDAHGCQAKDSVTLTQPPKLQATFVTTDVKCNGGSDGEINLFVFGGTPIYSYDWSNGETLQDLFDITAGDYSVEIRDDNNCLLIKNMTIYEPLPLATSFDVTDAKCFNSEDGEIDLTVTGGTVPYTFVWSNEEIVLGDTEEDLDSLFKGKYTVRVTDAHLCLHVDSTEVKEAFLLISNVVGTDVTCFNGSDGAVDLTVTGGTLPYTYLWSNGATTQDITAIISDHYSVTIADSNGCTTVAQILVDQPDDVSFGFAVSDVSCKDNDDGAVTLYASGGTPPYNYSWSNGAGSKDISDLLGGLYTIYLTDSHGCPYSASVEVHTDPRECINLVTIPNTFTPNGDGINDYWIIRNYELYPQIKVQVISRWGSTVFTSTGYSQPWNGFNGKEISSGTYYYIVDLGNGDAPFSGSITVIK